MKKCLICGLEQPDLEFYRNSPYCHPCRKEDSRQRYKAKLSEDRKRVLESKQERFKLPLGVKTCKVCGVAKLYSAFHSKGKCGWAGRDSHCKECRNARQRNEDYANASPEQQQFLDRYRAARALPKEIKAKTYADRLIRLRSKRARSLKCGVGCKDCGGLFPPECLEFDHLPGYEKVAGVADLINRAPLEVVKAEIAKCDLVCANCHRIRTVRRRAGLPGTFPPPDYEI